MSWAGSMIWSGLGSKCWFFSQRSYETNAPICPLACGSTNCSVLILACTTSFCVQRCRDQAVQLKSISDVGDAFVWRDFCVQSVQGSHCMRKGNESPGLKALPTRAKPLFGTTSAPKVSEDAQGKRVLPDCWIPQPWPLGLVTQTVVYYGSANTGGASAGR